MNLPQTLSRALRRDLPDLPPETELTDLYTDGCCPMDVRQAIEEEYGDTTQQAFERCQTVADLEALVAGLCAEAVL